MQPYELKATKKDGRKKNLFLFLIRVNNQTNEKGGFVWIYYLVSKCQSEGEFYYGQRK